jgi:phosphinothricin acetyltransferase
VLGLETGSGTLRGFATYGTFRDWPAYRYTVETSVYVRPGHRRQGVGRQLMQELIRAATDDGYHVLVAGIEATQQESIALHESLGFEFAGTICQAGFKFDRWLDLSFYQLLR